MLGLDVLFLKIGLQSLFRGVHLASFHDESHSSFDCREPGSRKGCHYISSFQMKVDSPVATQSFNRKGAINHAQCREYLFGKAARGKWAAHGARTARNDHLMQGLAAGGGFTHDHEQS